MTLLRVILPLLLLCAAGPALAYPVAVAACNDAVRFDHAPLRPVVNDSNMVQTVIDMGLTSRFVGFGSVKRPLDMNILKGPPAALGWVKAHQIADRYPSTEQVLGANPDFYFAGWNFGLGAQTGVTPEALGQFGVKTYVLNESCIRIGKRAPVSMETMYADVRALGRIFNVEPRAEAMIAGFKTRVAVVTARTSKAKTRPKVMYCGTCDSDGPVLVIGAEGMPAALITLAGGTNLYPEIADSYVRVGWETVIARDPDWILLAPSGIPADQAIRYLTTAPALKNLTAVKKRQFIVMTYPERSPSTRNVEALERLARTIHPELFKP